MVSKLPCTEENPIAFVGGLHYAAITDAAWSPDGKTLVVSSSDGYCSVLSFTDHELGRVLTPEEAGPASGSSASSSTHNPHHNIL